jgi:hypothetical protein
MKPIYFTIAAFLFIITACEKKLDIDLPDSEHHIVLNGISSPDSIIRVIVTKSQNALDNDQIVELNDAIVQLYRNGEYVEDMQHIGSGLFESSILAQQDESYMIMAEYNELESVTVKYSLQEPIPIARIDTAFEVETYDYGDGYSYSDFILHYSVSIDDHINTNDYYFLSVSRLMPLYSFPFGEPVFEGYYEEVDYIDSNNPVLSDYNNEFVLDGMWGKVFSDEIFNGTLYELDFETYLYYDYGGDIVLELDEPAYLVVKLLTVNEDIFRYIYSFNLNQESEFDPFAQPVQIFSNVENGLGLMSGYTMHTDTIELNYNFGE